jgi:hypothetical protein
MGNEHLVCSPKTQTNSADPFRGNGELQRWRSAVPDPLNFVMISVGTYGDVQVKLPYGIKIYWLFDLQ